VNAGPYVNFNTVSINGIQYDKKALGLMVAAVLERDLNRHGLKVRAEFIQTWVPGSFNSRAVLVGVSQALDTVKEDGSHQSEDSNSGEWSVMLGRSKINATDGGFGLGAKVKRVQEIENGFIYSFSMLTEGDSVVANRSGVAAQIGYRVELAVAGISAANLDRIFLMIDFPSKLVLTV
jgi:hypothetical protein